MKQSLRYFLFLRQSAAPACLAHSIQALSPALKPSLKYFLFSRQSAASACLAHSMLALSLLL
jgi:hypothetical protein